MSMVARPGREMAAAQLAREERLREMIEHEHVHVFGEMAGRVQSFFRGNAARGKARAARERLREAVQRARAASKIQQIMRGYLGRQFVAELLELETKNLTMGRSAVCLQSAFRGSAGRRRAYERKCEMAAQYLQRVFRGCGGRVRAAVERARLEGLRRRGEAAEMIRGAWRMKVAREEFQILRVRAVAAEEIQRCFRGHVGRRRARRRRDWENAQPGPDRLRLGLRIIEESKVAFERQREEIDTLHRAQEKAESRVSHIHAELRESEEELSVLERELQEIDQVERDLQELTHQRHILQLGVVEGAAGFSAANTTEATTDDDDDNHDRDKGSEKISLSTQRKNQAESQALEIAIHRKRAEREQKRQELEAEFASVFQEVSRKKQALERLEVSISDMDATRLRKDREFQRLQRNLMELLQEQKFELDALREKGIELETATATSAAAATATALRAKEHEARTATMFNQTEELMKFQFMSMSLSYFSSLSMLQQMREMNADTTTAAIASSADAAAACAAAATAANVPSVKHMKLGSDDIMAATVKKKQAELDAARIAEEDAKKSKAEPFPSEMRRWSVSDVGRWLDTLVLGQYRAAFREASVDGEFLLELREEDLVQVLGMEHKLHVRKVILARDKLKPLSEADIVKRAIVIQEEAADAKREHEQIPAVDTVFSQARNGRLKRLEESLNLGFEVDKEDEKGNTLLCIAAQNVNIKMVELLLGRNANINHSNANGNTPLHFAMAYDPEGTLAEYLIHQGADDTVENNMGYSCYDGIGADKG